MLSSATEMLFALGLGEQVVAVSHECDYPPGVEDRLRVTISHVDAAALSGAIDSQVKQTLAAGEPLYGIDETLLRQLAPDLVVTQSQCDVCAINHDDVLDVVRRIDPAGEIPVLALNPQTLSDIFADILNIGLATDRFTEAETLVQKLSNRVESIREATAGLSETERPRTAMIEWIDPPMLAANWAPELLEIAGGRCPLVTPGTHSTYAAWSEVVALDPEVIVVMPCGFDLARSVQEAATLAEFEGWHELTAVRTGRVFAVDGNALFNRSGPRIVESVELLAHLLHPERFDEPAANAGQPPAFCPLRT